MSLQSVLFTLRNALLLCSYFSMESQAQYDFCSRIHITICKYHLAFNCSSQLFCAPLIKNTWNEKQNKTQIEFILFSEFGLQFSEMFLVQDCNFLFQPKSKHLTWWINVDPAIYWYVEEPLEIGSFYLKIKNDNASWPIIKSQDCVSTRKSNQHYCTSC